MSLQRRLAAFRRRVTYYIFFAFGWSRAHVVSHRCFCGVGMQRCHVLILRCWAVAAPGNQASFIGVIEEAMGIGPLGQELRAVLLLAYHKMAKGATDTFPSITKETIARRGFTRPRRPRPGCEAGSGVTTKSKGAVSPKG